MLCVISVCTFAQHYMPQNSGTAIKFKVKNLGFNVGGSFTGIKGTIVFDEAKPADASFDITVDAASVNTDNDMRDNHLREDSYFDVKNYPVIHFVSSKITAEGGKGHYVVAGKLTIKKTTKEISFPFTATAGNEGMIFDGEFKINRRDYGVGSSSTISDNVTLNLHVVAKK